jgi:YVTN family beta-propeller protein
VIPSLCGNENIVKSWQKTIQLIIVLGLFISSPGQADIFDFFRGDSLANGNRYAFVPALDKPLIVSIDTIENKIAAEIPIDTISGPIVVSEQLDLLITTSPEQNRITLIDLKSREKLQTINIDMRPDAALLNPFDRYVAFGSKDGELSVWDMQSYEKMFSLDGLGNATKMTYSFDGRELYLVNELSNSISVIEMHSKSKIADISLGESITDKIELSALSRSVDGFTEYVSITSENRLVIIDLMTAQVKKSIPMDDEPVRPYSTADNRYVLIPHRNGKVLTVLSSLSHEIIATIPTRVAASEINTGWLDTVAFIMPSQGNNISIINLNSLSHSGFIELSGNPDAGLVTSDSKKMLTALTDTGSIAIIDARKRNMISTLTTSANALQGIDIGVSNNVCH